MGKERASVPLGVVLGLNRATAILSVGFRPILSHPPRSLCSNQAPVSGSLPAGGDQMSTGPAAGPPSRPLGVSPLPRPQALPRISGQFLPSEKKTGSRLVGGTTSPQSSCLPDAPL